jgi:succinate dehydrogenase/fumarate reductase flavoprotein subunit
MNHEVNRFTSDVLIVGGGIGGLTAAVTIKEKNPNASVIIVEKQTTGYAGKANKGGGVLQYFDLSRVNPQEFAAYHAHSVGCYLGDQDMMIKYVSMNNIMLDKLLAWGVKVPINEDGSYNVIPTSPMTAMIGIDLDVTLQVRKTAEKMGVKIIDKVTLSDIIVTDGKAAGAVCYSILDGAKYVFNAKAIIMATGSQNYRIGPMWSNGRGDGIAACYRVGAEMRNPEFGNFAQLLKIKSHQEVVFGENVMYNGLGENITKNFRRFPESDVNGNTIREWYRQVSSGKGPVVLHPEESGPTKNETMMFTVWDRPYGLPFWKANFEKAEAVDTDCEVCPVLIGEQSPLKVDHNMQTTIRGLYGIGDMSYCGSTSPGAVPAPPGRNRGSGILNAVFTGILGAEHAVAELDNLELLPVFENDVEASFARTFAPLEREEGSNAKDVIRLVQKAVGPMEHSVYMSEPRMEQALKYVEKAKELVPQLKAMDFHDLLACHEAEAMVLSAEMQFRAALMRKESRGWFTREDYPQMDNHNWLKWITVKNDNGEMVFGTEDVPYEKWAIKPPGFN